jgi:hypothetical protein
LPDGRPLLAIEEIAVHRAHVAVEHIAGAVAFRMVMS